MTRHHHSSLIGLISLLSCLLLASGAWGVDQEATILQSGDNNLADILQNPAGVLNLAIIDQSGDDNVASIDQGNRNYKKPFCLDRTVPKTSLRLQSPDVAVRTAGVHPTRRV